MNDAPTVEWPEIRPIEEWKDTLDTVQLWTQVVGKVRLGLTPLVNHWWNVPLYVSSRGLTTSLMHAGGRGVEIAFDFVDQQLLITTTDGGARRLPLEPQTVAHFHRTTMAALDELGVEVEVRTNPVELERAIPFEDDTEHGSYDAIAVAGFWRALVRSHRVFEEFRSRFAGKASPIHFFWGAFDLATTRFSGRAAPPHKGGIPNCPDWVMQEAYSQELSSCGFWPGGSDEGSFYAYAYPEPDGFADWSDVPAEASYVAELGEFVLPYRSVRTAADPDALLLNFLQSTYEAAAVTAGWDREALEVPSSASTREEHP